MRLKSCAAGRGKGERPHAVAQGEDGDLLALEQLLDDDGIAECRRSLQCRVELSLRRANEHAFPGSEPVGLDHTRGARDGEHFGRRNSGGVQHVLGERLRAFDPRCVRARAEDRDAQVPELVRDPGDEWCLGPDDHEVGLERPREAEQALAVLGANGMARA
jgi:hypothetical protein